MSGTSGCEVQSCGCPVSGHGAGCPVSGHGAGCGCPVTGHRAGCPVTGHGTCPVCGHLGGIADPFTNSPDVWIQHVTEAIRQVQVDILKAKVQKAFGPMLEKGADAALECAETTSQALFAQSTAFKAKEDLRERIRKIFSEKPK